MTTFADVLANRTCRELSALARAHCLPFNNRQSRSACIAQLYDALVTRQSLRQRVRALSPAEVAPLMALKALGDELPLRAFTNRFGAIRPYRPWREDDDKQPWTRPISEVETLWYLGFIDVLPSPARVAAPIEVLALLPALPLPKPVRKPRTPMVSAAPTLLMDIAALMATLLHADIHPLSERWLPLWALHDCNRRLMIKEELAGRRSELQTGRIRFLHYLATLAGLIGVESGCLKPTISGWQWLSLTPQAALHHLWARWIEDQAKPEGVWRRFRFRRCTEPILPVVLVGVRTEQPEQPLFRCDLRFRQRAAQAQISAVEPAHDSANRKQKQNKKSEPFKGSAGNRVGIDDDGVKHVANNRRQQNANKKQSQLHPTPRRAGRQDVIDQISQHHYVPCIGCRLKCGGDYLSGGRAPSGVPVPGRGFPRRRIP